MTTSTFRFDLDELQNKMATRPHGQAFLDAALTALETHQQIEIDFCHHSPTPSFADQSIGGLARIFGFDEFKKRIRLVNVSDEVRPLLKHIISARAGASSES